MALADRWAGVVGGVLSLGMLIAGCHEQHAEAPATGLGSVRSVPVSNRGEERSEEGAKVRGQEDEGPPTQDSARGSSEKALRPSPVPTFLPSSSVAQDVNANQAAPEARKTPAKASKAEPSGSAVELTLKFVPGQAATYKIATELQKSVEWKGAAARKPAQFTDGRTGNHIELTFEQRAREVQGDGSAILEVTIKGLKYVGEVVNKVVLDFDSARPEDSGNPLAALISKSYQVKISPKGQVLEISGADAVRQAAQGALPGQSVALRLLSNDEIRNRHEIAALTALKESSVRPGQSWSNVRTFSFDDLGTKTYERIYTLQQVGSGQLSVPSSQSPAANSQGRLAVVEMKAIPSAARAAELHRGPASPFIATSDNTDRYDGRLVLDLDSGQIREYTEQMLNEWIIADPGSMQTGQPTAIKMAARRLYRLERIQ
jgi:hypothetical protein